VKRKATSQMFFWSGRQLRMIGESWDDIIVYEHRAPGISPYINPQLISKFSIRDIAIAACLVGNPAIKDGPSST
jgi:hypothetical protein